MERLAKLIYWGIIIAICYYLFPIFIPFLLALVIAIILEPLVIDFQRKTKVKRHISAITIMTSFFAVIFVTLYFSFSTIIRESIKLLKEIPNLITSIITENDHIREMYNNLSEETKGFIMDAASTLAQKGTELGSKFAGGIFDIVMSFPAYFVAFIIFSVAVYIISIELPRLKNQFLSFFESGDSRDKVEISLDKLKTSIVGFMKSQIILSLLTFFVSVIGLLLIGTDYVIVMSLVIVVVDLLPVLGTGSVLVPWAIYFFVIGNVGQGIGLVVLFVFITAFRRVIEPKLIGDSIGLNPLLTLISLYVGFELMGIIGMILGPIVAIVIISLVESGLIKIKFRI